MVAGIVDTLGCVSTIASDKTGTLTENKMSVSHLMLLRPQESDNPAQPPRRSSSSFHGGDAIRPPETAVILNAKEMKSLSVPRGQPSESVHDLKQLYRSAVLCSRASYLPSPENMDRPAYDREVDGDATEKGIFRFCEHVDEDEGQRLRDELPKLGEIPFNSRHKWQMSVHQQKENASKRLLIVLKGAPERVVAMCVHASIGGITKPITPEIRQSLTLACEYLGSQGERVLAFADAEVPKEVAMTTGELTEDRMMELLQRGMRFLGLMSLIDPPRKEVSELL